MRKVLSPGALRNYRHIPFGTHCSCPHEDHESLRTCTGNRQELHRYPIFKSAARQIYLKVNGTAAKKSESKVCKPKQSASTSQPHPKITSFSTSPRFSLHE